MKATLTSGNHTVQLLILLVLGFSACFYGNRLVHFADAVATSTELPSMSLTVVGANGTQIILNETDVARLASFRGYGGFKNQLGILKGLGNYTGVPLGTLCSLVGVLTSTSIVRVLAADNYSKTFSYAEVNGEFVTYDNVTGAEVLHSQPLVPVVAYYVNDVAVAAADGPLRIAIIGPEGLATNSSYWVKQVVRIEVVDEAVPEFSSLLVLTLLFIAAVASALYVKSSECGKGQIGWRDV